MGIAGEQFVEDGDADDDELVLDEETDCGLMPVVDGFVRFKPSDW